METKSKESQQKAYLAYIENHVSNVYKVYQQIKGDLKSIITLTDDEWKTLEHNILEHDASKYSDEEFEPYRAHFYPVDEDEKKSSEEAFEEAWKHHYSVNPHHWNYWLTNAEGNPGNVLEMDKIYLIEMICDWMAMSLVKGGTAKSYYEEHRWGISLHLNTREDLEYLLDCLANKKIEK